MNEEREFDCPYCGDMLISLVHAGGEHEAAKEGFRLHEGEQADRFTADVTLDLHGVTRRFPMEFTIVDRETRRIEGEVTLRRDDEA